MTPEWLRHCIAALRSRRDAELARRTDQAARTKGAVNRTADSPEDEMVELISALFATAVKPPHICALYYACCNHQERRS